MTLVEIIGNQHLRILALEETVGQLQGENSRLKEKLLKQAKTQSPVSEPAPQTSVEAGSPAEAGI